jgi:hypothetical protein
MIMIKSHPERVEALLASRVLPTPDDPNYEVPESISESFDNVDAPDTDKRLIEAGGFEAIPEDEGGEEDGEGEESKGA